MSNEGEKGQAEHRVPVGTGHERTESGWKASGVKKKCPDGIASEGRETELYALSGGCSRPYKNEKQAVRLNRVAIQSAEEGKEKIRERDKGKRGMWLSGGALKTKDACKSGETDCMGTKGVKENQLSRRKHKKASSQGLHILPDELAGRLRAEEISRSSESKKTLTTNHKSMGHQNQRTHGSEIKKGIVENGKCRDWAWNHGGVRCEKKRGARYEAKAKKKRGVAQPDGKRQRRTEFDEKKILGMWHGWFGF